MGVTPIYSDFPVSSDFWLQFAFRRNPTCSDLLRFLPICAPIFGNTPICSDLLRFLSIWKQKNRSEQVRETHFCRPLLQIPESQTMVSPREYSPPKNLSKSTMLKRSNVTKLKISQEPREGFFFEGVFANMCTSLGCGALSAKRRRGWRYTGKMGSMCHFPRALPASIWGHCSQILVFTSTWGPAFGYFGSPKHCKTRENAKWQIDPALPPHWGWISRICTILFEIITFLTRKHLLLVTALAENHSESLRAIISCSCILLEKNKETATVMFFS